MIDTTLPNIADRWKELKLPIAKDPKKVEQMKTQLRNVFEKKWEGQKGIEALTKEYGRFTT